MRMYVVIATVGRASLTKLNVSHLLNQTRPPDGIIVCGAKPEDVEGVADVGGPVTVMLSQPGSCDQRNAALETVVGKADVVTFFDDDFFPRQDYLQRVERLFSERPEVVGLTGRLIADGATSSGIESGPALAMLADDVDPSDAEQTMQALYGCNMSVRTAALDALRFDENLPFYAWLEDIDFSYQLGKRGQLIKADELAGVHLGIKRGRTSGKRMGYSQIANVIYLKRKGTMQPYLGERMVMQNVLSNIVKSLRPEPYIDRRGRLHGNLLAVGDLLTGKLHPGRIRAM